MSVRRFDRGELQKPQKMENGWLRVDAYLGRTGILEYRKDDGSIHRELRRDAEAFHPDTLKSFALVPLTLEHPPVPLDANNTREYAVGTTGENIRRDGERVAGPLHVTDAETVKQVLRGDRREISMAYTCDLLNEPGEFEGQKYDAIQTNIRGNHVAIVRRGRAGPEVRIQMDAADAIESTIEVDSKDDEEKDETPMKKIRIDGVEFDGSEQLEQALSREMAKHDAAIAALKADAAKASQEVEAMKAKLDAAKEELEKEKKAHADAADPKRMREIIGARLRMEDQAKKILGPKAEKLDALTDKELRFKILEKLAPNLDTKNKSDAYIDARFDLAMEAWQADAADEGEDELAEARRAAAPPRRKNAEDETEYNADNADADAARQRMIERDRNHWRKPLMQKA